jgi:hypothetical protein
MTDKLDKAALRLELRKLYDDSPEAFEQIIEQLQGMAVADATMGPDPTASAHSKEYAYLDRVLPPIKIVRGKPAKRGPRPALPSEYRRFTVVEKFYCEAQRCRWGNGYTMGYINIEHLKAAEKSRMVCRASKVFTVQVAGF